MVDAPDADPALLPACRAAIAVADRGRSPPPASHGPTPSPSARAAPSTDPVAGSRRPPEPGSAPTAGPSATRSRDAGAPPTLTLEPVVDGLDCPLDIALGPATPRRCSSPSRSDGSGSSATAPSSRPRSSTSASAVTAGGEQGLLGVAVHPDPADGRVFVYYTDRDERQVVASFRTDPADPGPGASPTASSDLLVMDDPFGNHNGGGLQFGPDGYLYISTGDGGGGGDPLGLGPRPRLAAGQDPAASTSTSTADSDPPYAIPADNPFVDRDGRPARRSG